MAFHTLVRRLPWVMHLATVLAVSAYVVKTEVDEYGLERHGGWSLGPVMSWGILAAPVVLTVPVAVAEVWATARSRPWLKRVAAVVASALIAWVAMLPVGLRFFASRDPVLQSDVEMAAGSLLVMIVGQAVVLLSLSAVAAGRAGGGVSEVLGGPPSR